MAGGGVMPVAAEDADEEEELTSIEEEEVPLAVVDLEDEGVDEDGLVRVGEEEVPLAAGDLSAENPGHGLWWSIIPLVIAGVTGKTAYDKKNRKGIFSEKKTVENPNDTK